MRLLLFCLLGFVALPALAQPAGYKADWELFSDVERDTVTTTNVDMGFRPYAPVAGYTHHLTLTLHLREPLPSGLASDAELAVLGRVEDRLGQVVMENGNAVVVGFKAGRGRRTFHFYSRTALPDTALMATAFILYPAYKHYDLASVPDSGWRYYLDALYPSPRELRKTHNNRQIGELVRAGDGLMAERPVSHFLSFTTRKKADSYFSKVKKQGYAQVSITTDTARSKEHPVQLCIRRSEGITPATVEQNVMALYDLAPKYQGIYDGWQTVVLKAE